METLVRICETLNCGILDVIELEQTIRNTAKKCITRSAENRNDFLRFSYASIYKKLFFPLDKM